MIDAAYERITAVIQHGRGSRLIVVLVPPEIPLLRATEALQSHLLGRGITVRSVQAHRHSNLVEVIEAAAPGPAQVVVVHGIDALPRVDRESFLRASSFARARLRSVPVAVILVLGTETWSWLGMELPDLARWADGPFLVSDHSEASVLPRSGLRPPSFPFSRSRAPSPATALLDEYRNIDLEGPLDNWIERGGVLLLGGPPYAGVTDIAARIAVRLESLGWRISWGRHESLDLLIISDDESVPQPLEAWLDVHATDAVIIHPAFSANAPSELARRGMTGVVLGSTRAALATPLLGETRLYVPPVQVVEVDGRPHDAGVAAMVRAIRVDAGEGAGALDSLLSHEQLSTLAYASGGQLGRLWGLVVDADERVRRLGTSNATDELVRSIILDTASATEPPSDEDLMAAVTLNLLDFELEARGDVLFYVIDGQLRTLRHPLLTLVKRLQADVDELTS